MADWEVVVMARKDIAFEEAMENTRKVHEGGFRSDGKWVQFETPVRSDDLEWSPFEGEQINDIVLEPLLHAWVGRFSTDDEVND